MSHTRAPTVMVVRTKKFQRERSRDRVGPLAGQPLGRCLSVEPGLYRCSLSPGAGGEPRVLGAGDSGRIRGRRRFGTRIALALPS